MKELTPLERRIKAEALCTIRRMKESIAEWVKTSSTRYVKFMMLCDDVFDTITFDIKTKEFTVEYEVGKGKGFSLIGNKSGYYDEVETRTLTFKAPIAELQSF